jgi:hypothetical protein
MAFRVVCAVALLGSIGCGFGGGAGAIPGATTAASVAPPASSAPTSLVQATVVTDGLTLAAPGVGQQLLVEGLFSDGHVRDLTRAASWSVVDPTVASIDSLGIAHAIAAGDTDVEASVAGVLARGTLHVAPSAVAAPPAPAAPVPGAPTWVNDVRPLLQQLGCAKCHAHPRGPFRLTHNGDVNYTFITTHGYLEPKSPALSRLLLKATNQIAHAGGAILAPNDPAVALLESWIGAGAPYDANGGAPAPSEATAIAALPFPNALLLLPGSRNCVDPGAEQQLLVLAWWKNGTVADVTRAADIAVSDSSVAAVDATGFLAAQGSSGIVALGASWGGLAAGATCACDPSAPLADGDGLETIVLAVGSPPTVRDLRSGTTLARGSPGTSPSTGTGSTGSGRTGSGSAAPSFTNDVLPLLGTLGCAGCHAAPGAFNLPGSAAGDLSEITSKGLIDTASPASSLLLVKPVDADGSHPGGKILDPSTAAYKTILSWIAAGAQP